jgi:hypothetical protein
MFAVRYAALLALVVWLTALAGGAAALGPAHGVSFVCGALVLMLLFVQKFVGPPPHGFVPRAAITAVMLALAVYDLRLRSAIVPWMDIALGLVLLGWYARE